LDEALIAALPQLPQRAIDLITLGMAHEQQHQELMLTDLLALFAENPLLPTVWETPSHIEQPIPALRWIEGRHGIVEIGHGGEDFAFDCEGPRHPVLLHRHALASRTVTNSEWLAFIADGGYRRPDLWLSDGWTWVQSEHIEAPLYWRQQGGGWQDFGLDGLHPIRLCEPVTHISHYEADAYARWAGARLPTEAEWESAAQASDPASGNQLDEARPVRPEPVTEGDGLRGLFGDVWEWTGSAYLAYPGFQPAKGAVGE
jgi:ergothioneine biosynthesis protein EgtB